MLVVSAALRRSPTSFGARVTPGAALDAVAGLVGYIRVTAGPAPEADGWIPATSMVHDPDALYATMHTAMAGRGIDRDDIGMSLIVQGYAFRIASAAIGTWLVSGGVLDVSPANASIQFGRNRPNAVLLARADWATPPGDHTVTLADLQRQLVDEHLAVIVDTARRACRVGGRMLWSNVASSCASSFGAFMAPWPDRWEWVRERAQEFFTVARPELGAGGEVVPIGPAWAWQRHACCLYYQHADGSKCEDCSLLSEGERSTRYARLLAGVRG